MLALATTRATVTGRPAGAKPRDSHGAPLPQTPEVAGPYDAHRRPFSAAVRGAAGRGGDDEQQTHLATWYLDPSAWPVHVGDTITDVDDGTAWRVTSADLVPTGLGLEQVMAACSQLDVTAN